MHTLNKVAAGVTMQTSTAAHWTGLQCDDQNELFYIFATL